mmetsp:Transcript_60500/g.96056  ORF Transcript_60500/g.96056 Transcript_60500/m.96056 type:complete len:265 (-) Transcript_60500:1274-2068(-)
MDLREDSIEVTFLGHTHSLSVCLSCHRVSFCLLCVIFLSHERCHLILRIFFERIKLSLCIIFVCFCVATVFHDVLMNHFQNRNYTHCFSSLSSIGGFPSRRWRWRSFTSCHASYRLLAFLHKHEVILFIESLQDIFCGHHRLRRFFILFVCHQPRRMLIFAHLSCLFEVFCCLLVFYKNFSNPLLHLLDFSSELVDQLCHLIDLTRRKNCISRVDHTVMFACLFDLKIFVFLRLQEGDHLVNGLNDGIELHLRRLIWRSWTRSE